MNVEERKKFLEVLFDLDEKIAWGDDSTAFKARSPIPEFFWTNDPKFCINPLVQTRNTKDIVDNGNLYSMLFEVDKDSLGNEIPTDIQVNRFLDSALPFTSMVYSGKKSVHVIIRFTEPMQDRWEQKSWWKTISQALLKWDLPIDEKAGLIPQLSRLPGSIRTGTGEEQRLIHLGNRVTKSQMKEWLASQGQEWIEVLPPKPVELDWNGNDHVSSIKRFNLAIKWNTKQHGIYSTYSKSGGHIWLFNFGLMCWKLDIPLESSQRLSVQEWGQTYNGSNGGGETAVVVKKGWDYGMNNAINKIQLK
jgi:hypothetical protein